MFKVVLEYKISQKVGAKTSPVVRKLDQLKSQTLAKLQNIPGPVVYPIQWTTERQRRAFFATNGFGKGIPTKRTGAVAKAWVFKIDRDMLDKFWVYHLGLEEFIGNVNPKAARRVPKYPTGSVIVTIDNPIPYERYVTGIQQQRFHANTGWVYVPPVIEGAVEQIEGILETGFVGA